MTGFLSVGESSVAAESQGHPRSTTAGPVPLRVEQVMDHLREAIKERRLKPGDRVPAERELAQELGVSRGTVRAALGCLAAMGLLRIRHSVGTFVADGPPEFGKASLGAISALHGFQPWQMIEARRVVEGGLAALAARRGRQRDFAAMAENLAEMYAACDDPERYAIHHVLFLRSIARASGNPILASFAEAVASEIRSTQYGVTLNIANLRESADCQREIYRSIRLRDAARARSLMEQSLRWDQCAPRARRSDKLCAPMAPIGSIRQLPSQGRKPERADDRELNFL